MKQFSRILLTAALSVAIAASCNPENKPVPEDVLETITYTASNEDFPNPERGFYNGNETHSATGQGVPEGSINAARKMGRTLYLLEFYLTDYVETDISEAYLQTIRNKFQSLRDGGMKCILRFAYSNGFDVSDKPWDASQEQVARHLEQVKPLIREFSDIIMVVQAGFIGSWGEWYYTDHFGANSARKALIDALLEAVPENRQIELRTPGYKMRLFGYTLEDTITRAEAHLPTAKARIGGHNDCYLSSANDVGTFVGVKDRQYWEAETQYTIMGGESCELADYCHCKGNGKYRGALKDLAAQHFTYLNSGYHQSVLRRWREEGCMEEIQKRLGYRFVLEEGQFTKEPKAGEPLRVILKVRNDGFASAMNPRDVELVLAAKDGSIAKRYTVDSDPRFWMPGETATIDQTIDLPSGLSGGEYTLSLNLPDPCETLHNNPLFSIRLANENTWQEETGFNTVYTFSL